MAPAQATPASRLCSQGYTAPIPLNDGHDSRDVSDPVQKVSSKWMGPDPSPKQAPPNAVAPFIRNEISFIASRIKLAHI